MWKSARHVFVRRGNLIVQVRGEEHSVEALDAQETGFRLARAQVRGPIGAFLLIEEDAPAPRGEVARRQREIVAMFGADERVYVCLVLEGSGASVQLKRTIARALFRSERRHIAGNVQDGARWLSPHIGLPADEIIAFAESQRPK
jgi:hypothetical protein